MLFSKTIVTSEQARLFDTVLGGVAFSDPAEKRFAFLMGDVYELARHEKFNPAQQKAVDELVSQFIKTYIGQEDKDRIHWLLTEREAEDVEIWFRETFEDWYNLILMNGFRSKFAHGHWEITVNWDERSLSVQPL